MKIAPKRKKKKPERVRHSFNILDPVFAFDLMKCVHISEMSV
jgi:hypothetical protein